MSSSTMTSRVIRVALAAVLLSSALVLGVLRAQETATPPANPPATAAPEKPAENPPKEEDEEAEPEPLPPGESLSADNNLSYPVDI